MCSDHWPMLSADDALEFEMRLGRKEVMLACSAERKRTSRSHCREEENVSLSLGGFVFCVHTHRDHEQ